jgi:hypothetical protein
MTEEVVVVEMEAEEEVVDMEVERVEEVRPAAWRAAAVTEEVAAVVTVEEEVQVDDWALQVRAAEAKAVEVRAEGQGSVGLGRLDAELAPTQRRRRQKLQRKRGTSI